MASKIPIKIVIENVGEVEGELNEDFAPRTVELVAKKLPLEGQAARWKGEVFFKISPIGIGPENPKQEVEAGTITYCATFNSFCIFYQKSRPFTPATPLGKVLKNLEVIKSAKPGTKIRIEAIG